MQSQRVSSVGNVSPDYEDRGVINISYTGSDNHVVFDARQLVFKTSTMALLKAKGHDVNSFIPEDGDTCGAYLQGCKLVMDYMNGMYMAQELCDVLIPTSRDDLKAHKIVLGAYSDTLTEKFASFPAGEVMCIDMSDFPYETVLALLHFLYTTEINITPENVYDLQQVATELGIDILIQLCNNLLPSVTVETALDSLGLAEQQGLDQHRAILLDFISQHWSEIIETQGFNNLTPERIAGLLVDERPNLSPLDRFDCIVRWLSCDIPERMPYAAALLASIGLQTIAPEILASPLVEGVTWVWEPRACHDILYAAMRGHALGLTKSQAQFMETASGRTPGPSRPTTPPETGYGTFVPSRPPTPPATGRDAPAPYRPATAPAPYRPATPPVTGPDDPAPYRPATSPATGRDAPAPYRPATPPVTGPDAPAPYRPATPPATGHDTSPPNSGGSPPRNGFSTPPPRSSYATPPSRLSNATPPPRLSNATPPPRLSNATPPPRLSNAAPPPQWSNAAPPPGPVHPTPPMSTRRNTTPPPSSGGRASAQQSPRRHTTLPRSGISTPPPQSGLGTPPSNLPQTSGPFGPPLGGYGSQPASRKGSQPSSGQASSTPSAFRYSPTFPPSATIPQAPPAQHKSALASLFHRKSSSKPPSKVFADSPRATSPQSWPQTPPTPYYSPNAQHGGPSPQYSDDQSPAGYYYQPSSVASYNRPTSPTGFTGGGMGGVPASGDRGTMYSPQYTPVPPSPANEGEIIMLPSPEGKRNPRIAVIGAGVIGMCSAVRIQECIPNAEIVLIADGFNEHTLSDGAAGLFRPSWEKAEGVGEDLLKQWVRDSWKKYSSLASSDLAAECGITVLSGFQFFNNPPKEPLLIDGIVYHVRKCTKKDYEVFNCGEMFEYGFAFTTVTIESKYFLPFLMNIFVERGGVVEQRTIQELEECVGYDVVVNATGLRSRDLCEDETVYAVRGQMERLKAPWLKHFVLDTENSTWIIPCRDTIIIGGTMQKNNESLGISQIDKERMIERAYKLVPSLKSAEFQWTWVGLRPFRAAVCVEKETFIFGSNRLQVVHNYGHGGHGISLAWGCGCYTAKLVQSFLKDHTSQQSLPE